MAETLRPDLCVIGAGSGGLSVAAGAVQMGASVVLVERGLMGGDCLNYGCVPSKALLAAGHVAETVRRGPEFGVEAGEPRVDFPAVQRHVRSVIEAIAPIDSQERFEGLGVTVIRANGTFTGPDELRAGDHVIRPRRFVIAAGSSPMVPPIEGLDAVPYFTNETIFENDAPLDHLVILGGGPIGLEMAQAHARLGCRITVVEMAAPLGKDDPELAAVVVETLQSEGIRILSGTRVTGVRMGDGGQGIVVTGAGPEGEVVVHGSHLLVALGRKPNLDGLGLDAAGIKTTPRGIETDAGLRTSNRRAFAVGDIAGRQQFTHIAGYHAGIVIRRVLFRLPAKVDDSAVPWVTYTEPELAQVGLTEREAEAAGHKVRVVRWPFTHNDRAQAERATTGLVKVVTGKGGRVLGAGIAGRHAGELIQPWILMVAKRMKIGAMAGIIAPYPTLAEVNKRAAGDFYTAALFSNRTRRIVKLLAKLG